MNYIELINNFWKADIEYSFTGNETKLYMFLLHTSNSLGWKNPFRLSYRQIELGCNLTVNTVKSARNKLRQAGLICFLEGRKGSSRDISNKTTYEIRLSNFDNQTGNQADNQPDNQTGNQMDNQPEDINKLKLKTINNIPLNPPEERDEEKLKVESGKIKKPKKEAMELKYPFSSEKFMNAWIQLINTPKWKKKIAYTLQLALNQLSKYEEEFAIKLIDAAAANDWQGVVFPQTDEQYSKWKSGRNSGKSNFANYDNTKHYDEF